MLTNSKFRLVAASAFAFTSINIAIAAEIDDQARIVSNSESIEAFEQNNSALREQEANLAGAVKDAIDQVGKLDQQSIANREYHTLLDDLGTQFSKGKIQEITQLNSLIMEFQRSEIALMENTAKYQEAKNKLSQQFERREDVVARISQLESSLSSMAANINKLQTALTQLINDNQSLRDQVSNISVSENASSSRPEPDGKTSAIRRMLNLDFSSDNAPQLDPLMVTDGANTIADFPPYMLTGTSQSKGRWVATFMDTNKKPLKVTEGSALAGGWTVSSISLDEATLKRGDIEHTLKRQ